MEHEQRFYTRSEAAQFLGVSVTTLMREVHAGKLYTFKVGRQVRIPAESLDDFVAGRPAHQAPADRREPMHADDGDTFPPTPSVFDQSDGQTRG